MMAECIGCKFGIHDENKALEPEDKISCFLNPPVLIHLTADYGGASIVTKANWDRPYVAQNDFCGHWKKRE